MQFCCLLDRVAVLVRHSYEVGPSDEEHGARREPSSRNWDARLSERTCDAGQRCLAATRDTATAVAMMLEVFRPPGTGDPRRGAQAAPPA